MKRRGSALGFARLASAPASSSRGVCSNSCQNFSAALLARAIERHTPNMIDQLRRERNASKMSTTCVTVVALSTRSTGVAGTAPRDAWRRCGTIVTVADQEREGSVTSTRLEKEAKV